MVQIQTSTIIGSPISHVFSYMVDYRQMPQWVLGIKRITPVGERDYGLGAVFEGAVDLGPKVLSSTFEITGWQEDEMIALTSSAGFDFTSTFRYTRHAAAETLLDIDLRYEFEGGLAGRALGRTLEPFILMLVKHTQRNLQRECLNRA